MTVDNRVDGEFPQLGVSLRVLDDDGSLRDVSVGSFPRGRSTQTRKINGCATRCQLETISFGGPAALVEAMHGRATIESFTVDGTPVPGVLDTPWRPQVSQINTRTAVQKFALGGDETL